ncbi:response regulator [Prosthecobacter fluviatilis]|uniref:histidine kinase n=1 Tax=Prosthecobacter fluviatilis TaxID=445931 RepID=A0ABW0KKP1_9BACT
MTRALIVDDKEENLYYLQVLLTGHGCEVITARHGAEALVKARQAPPDVVISDLLMPVMDGYTLLRHWKADAQLRNIPFIVYTATYTEAEDERLALSLGADAFILKPAEPEDFIARLKEVQSHDSAASPPTPRSPAGDEKALLKVYSETLIRKLEEKSLQLEEANRALQQDIAKSKHMEAQIRQTSNLLHAMADGIPDAVFVKDLQGRYLLFNKGASRLVGRPVEAVLGQDDTTIFSPEDARFVMANDREVMISGQTQMVEEVLTAAGVTRTYLVSKAPYRDSQGNIIGIIGISRDITERKQAENKIHEQATLLDKAQDAIVVRDLEHRILYWNRSAERLYGWTSKEAVGRSIKELLYQNPAPFLAATSETLEKGEWVGEIHQYNRDGKTLTIEGRWTLVRDDLGRPSSILAINTDITERKKLEQQFLRTQRMESIGTLAGGIAHDLNNVLAPILMSIELLRLQEKDARRLDILKTIETSAKRGADMVKQVLSFARGVEGRQVEVQIGHLLREIEKMANETFLKSIHVSCDVPTGLWTVLGDPTQLHQVLLNLCVNARDAMPTGGRLLLSARNLQVDDQYAAMNPGAKPGPHVVVVVEDNGSGMPPEVIERIFEPFYTTKELGKGTGLGLSTTQAIVKGHGGFIHVQSDLEVGTKFSVFLPAQTAGAPLAVTAENDLPRGNDELVLVIDDEASVRQITRQTLEIFGYRVLLAADGTEAAGIYVMRKNEIRAVITDMMMPEMDGAAIIPVLLRINPDVRIIASSGISTGGMASKAVNAGVKYFLPKPYTAETLLKTLNQALQTPA